MAPVVILFSIFATYFCIANGQTCSPPNGGTGTCRTLSECPFIQDVHRKENKTQHDLELLDKSQCGTQDKNVVCCPNPCYTPEGDPGTCVSIYSCPHLISLLKEVQMASIEYIRNSRCTGAEKYSVCCGPAASVNVVPIGNCAATVSAFPPDPKTECCGVDIKDGRWLSPNFITLDHYPWLALIEYTQMGKTQLLCGGALISGRYVLTAAHCVAGDVLKSGTPTNIRLAEFDTKNEGQDCISVEAGGIDCNDGIISIPIEQTIPHPDYNPTEKQSLNDIALIRLTKNAPYNDFIRPICLPTADVTAVPPEYFSLLAAGWGADPTNAPSSNLKHHIEMPFASNDKCEPAYKTDVTNLTATKICAGGIRGSDFCKVDSGGPLMYDPVGYRRPTEVIGVVSLNPTPCDMPNVPGVYTNVFEYLDWIRSTIVA